MKITILNISEEEMQVKAIIKWQSSEKLVFD